MMEKFVKLGDCVELIRDNINPKIISKVPYIGLEHIEESTLHLNGFGYSTEIDSTKLKFKKGDILFGKLRPYFRKVIIAPFDGICSTDIWVVRAKEGFDQKYIFYWMAGNDFVDFSMSGSEGTKMPRAKWEHVVKFERPYLDFTQQQKVGAVLSSFDDKIELNRQMNQTLEAMARAIFKSWFVDFDPVYAKMECRDYPLPSEIKDLFPDELEESELGLIPKGWRVGKIQDLTEKIENGGTPKRDNLEYWENGTIPWLTSGEVRTKLITNTQNFITEKGLKNSSAKMWDIGTVIVALYEATAGEVCRTSMKLCANQACCGLSPKKQSSNYLYITASNSSKKLSGLARGSAQQNLSKDLVSNYSIIIPTDNLLKVFNDLTNPIFQKQENNLLENETLEKKRFQLLPRLLTGQINF